MWLLNTARAELKFFATPESVPGGYAILSHVWDEHEDTFQSIQALRARCAEDGTNPRDLASDKIRNFCTLAERDGYEWGWDDTCCIDKTSSTDLSEAITAMYHYYSLADVCYVYLRDVPTDCDLPAPDSAFRKSRWHRRGWTLQELIAPPLVVLLSHTWEPLGSKADLARLLEEITRIPADILDLRDAPSSYCVAARMAWAADRETTRPEDEAYCLMGLFGISMPPLYGEGRKAFLRLQEEIVRRVDDPSVFAWGEMYDRRDSDMLSEAEPDQSSLNPDRLFARSPSDFRLGHHMRCREKFTPQGYPILGGYANFVSRADLSKLPTFTITPYAIEALAPVYAPFPQSNFIVVLLWGIELRPPGLPPQNLGVLLRLAGVHPAEQARMEDRLHRTHPSDDRSTRPAPLYPKHTHIPRSHVAELLRSPSVTSSALQLQGSDGIEDPGSQRTMTLAFTVQPPGGDVRFSIAIHLGLCPRASEGDPRHKHWAKAERQRAAGAGRPRSTAADPEGKESEHEHEHDCAKHHVDEWKGRSRTFAIGPGPSDALQRLRVKLAFEPYALNPAWVRKVHIGFDVGRASPVAKQPKSD
ncbi:hypothetical protein GSI_11265 [Ganoderma sinense ZZ0214-1]|uniref:Uncharacterized protein n=1 Tax=Ganoderma sinense ZZ0214-1 TaxID=1077348 RepID=A0A2G8RYQ0_9APHY|nr:hypothetical protein GSI_11265 [Ganoderma sinense ZZ0214-1]